MVEDNQEEMMVDVLYKELPSHVRVVMGADLEYKCNKIIGEEANDGFLLFKTSCGVTYSEGQDQTVCIIVLAFRRMYPKGKHGLI